jgi:hypothetical protein
MARPPLKRLCFAIALYDHSIPLGKLFFEIIDADGIGGEAIVGIREQAFERAVVFLQASETGTVLGAVGGDFLPQRRDLRVALLPQRCDLRLALLVQRRDPGVMLLAQRCDLRLVLLAQRTYLGIALLPQLVVGGFALGQYPRLISIAGFEVVDAAGAVF